MKEKKRKCCQGDSCVCIPVNDCVKSTYLRTRLRECSGNFKKKEALFHYESTLSWNHFRKWFWDILVLTHQSIWEGQNVWYYNNITLTEIQDISRHLNKF